MRDEKQDSSRQSSASGANTPDEWWNHWITSEATRRAAFAAFVIDSTHAVCSLYSRTFLRDQNVAVFPLFITFGSLANVLIEDNVRSFHSDGGTRDEITVTMRGSVVVCDK